MKTCFELASVALFQLLVSAGERRAACDPQQKQDHKPDSEEGVEHGSGPAARQSAHDKPQSCYVAGNSGTHGELRRATAPDRGNGHLHDLVLPCVCGGISVPVDAGTTRICDPGAGNSGPSADPADRGDLEGNRVATRAMADRIPAKARRNAVVISDLCTRCAGLYERFERHLAFGEVAHGEHEFRRNAVVRHLGDAPWRDAEGICKRFGSAALTFEPCLEIHGASLEQPKRHSQGFSKP